MDLKNRVAVNLAKLSANGQIPLLLRCAATSDYETVFDAVCRAAIGVGMTLNHADRVAGVISLSVPASFSSWGAVIGIGMGQVPEGGVRVDIHSALNFGLIDWGRNARDIDILFRSIDAQLGPTTQ